MIITKSIRNIGKADEHWIIARSVKQLPTGATHVPELAPSYKLLTKYLEWRKRGEWNLDKFNTEYAPQLIREIKYSAKAKAKLNELYKLSKQGKTIEIICFCEDEDLCHRSIIAGLLQAVGAEVTTENNKDHSHHMETYKNIGKEKTK